MDSSLDKTRTQLADSVVNAMNHGGVALCNTSKALVLVAIAALRVLARILEIGLEHLEDNPISRQLPLNFDKAVQNKWAVALTHWRRKNADPDSV